MSANDLPLPGFLGRPAARVMPRMTESLLASDLPGATDEELAFAVSNAAQSIAAMPDVLRAGVGLGSEVNSGLYHRPHGRLLNQWSREWAIMGLSAEALRPHSESIERELSVSTLPWAMPAASRVLATGARALSWRGREVPRWA